MRMLFYNQAGEISGAERVLLTILQHLKPEAATPMLCAPPGSLLAAAAHEGVRAAPVAPLVLGRTRNPLRLGGYAVRAGRPSAELAAVIRRARPDVVYANSIRSGLVAVTAARLSGRRPRVVVHLHDPVHQTALDRIAALYVGRLADMLIAVSQFVADGFAREQAKVRVLYNAVDPERFRSSPERTRAARERLGIGPDAPLLAVVGQLTPWKGQREALDALATIRAEIPNTHLLIAGSAKFTGRHRQYDTEAYQQTLTARAAQPDLAGAVHMTGEISDVASIYASATLVLVPSWYEAFAMVVLEAMAAERPLIASAAGGNLEIIRHDVDGWLVPPRDPAALAAAALGLLRDPQQRERLAANGHSRVVERHTIGPYMQRFSEILGLSA
ncbi:MAG: glycosyltransferase family 4 protein [Chloroflexi bacterium]|nr:glycosyltransferase family 4 protein [Chloroflexota bacterium]